MKKIAAWHHWMVLSGILISLVVVSCEKEKDYPEIGNVKLTNLSGSTFLATAESVRTGDYGLVDHGFIYYVGTYEPDLYIGNPKVSLGSTIENNTFSAQISFDIDYYYDNMKCYVRAYITDKKGTVYSDMVSKPILRLQANTISPAFANAGDTVFIYGENFETDIASNTVTFNNISALVTFASSNYLKVIVPDGISIPYSWNPYVTIKIKSGAQTVENSNTFQLKPVPEGFSPSSGTWGETIMLTGSGLLTGSVYLDNVQAEVYSRSSDYLYVSIPQSIQKKYFKISMMIGNSKMEVPGGYFTMNDMVTNPLEYIEYYPGNAFYISGSGFNPITGRNKVYIGENQVYSQDNYNGITVEIPGSLKTGKYSVSVTNSIDSIRLEQKLNIYKPVISGISANSGAPGSTISITGTNLTLSSMVPSLTLGPYYLYIVSQTRTSITFSIPSIPAGEYTLTCNYGNFNVIYQDNFTVTDL